VGWKVRKLKVEGKNLEWLSTRSIFKHGRNDSEYERRRKTGDRKDEEETGR
jgi:hypothetical protein